MKPPAPSYSELRACLKIGTSDLDIDNGLIGNSDFYFHAAQEHALAIARRDSLELELKETEAEVIGELKRKNSKLSDKMAEMQMRVDKSIREIQQELLLAKKQVALWKALESAFDKRHGSLRELVKWRIQQWHQTHIEGGSRSAKADLADYNRTRANLVRATRRSKADED